MEMSRLQYVSIESIPNNIIYDKHASSQVGIWRGAFLAKSGLFRLLSGRKWTFLLAFWKTWTFSHAFFEKVDFFACSPHVRGMFPGEI